MHRSRLVNLLVATGTGVVFLAGLLTSGVLAAVLLLVVAAFLIVLSAAAWSRIPARGRGARVLVVAVVLLIAVIKLSQR
jgi:hypothetical protein